jgi:hypothetical protein
MMPIITLKMLSDDVCICEMQIYVELGCVDLNYAFLVC